MAKTFINMYMDTSDMNGYWIVEYVDENGETIYQRFDTDLEAQNFYRETFPWS
jgi:hypothetical protein